MKDRSLSIYLAVVLVHWSTFKGIEAIGVKGCKNAGKFVRVLN
jgi:hypothetical protein